MPISSANYPSGRIRVVSDEVETTMKTITPLAILLLVTWASSGCLVSSSSQSKVSGNFVPPETFDQIEPGKTTAAWVKATLGEPSARDTADGTEVWKYKYTEEKDSSGAIFLIFAGNDKKERQHVAYVEIKEGVVTKKWRA
jgi:outer membrane protein assembly factor BamE (lipoprotein component of BamABCDE complex)